MKIVSLLDFAKTGQFGPITIGSTRTEVRTAFGDPTDYTARQPMELADVWRYGDLEIHFTDELVSLLYSDGFDIPEGGPTLKIDPWIIRRRLPLNDWERAAPSAGLEFDSAEDQINPRCIIVTTTAGVFFHFGIEEDPEGLYVFGISGKSRSTS
jgi:hypothetical protein